jgi:hypothetical protein
VEEAIREAGVIRAQARPLGVAAGACTVGVAAAGSRLTAPALGDGSRAGPTREAAAGSLSRQFPHRVHFLDNRKAEVLVLWTSERNGNLRVSVCDIYHF